MGKEPGGGQRNEDLGNKDRPQNIMYQLTGT